jgi:hypothetical protein
MDEFHSIGENGLHDTGADFNTRRDRRVVMAT